MPDDEARRRGQTRLQQHASRECQVAGQEASAMNLLLILMSFFLNDRLLHGFSFHKGSEVLSPDGD
jgi:hypothetical protein